MTGTSWCAPGRGASVAQLLSAAIQISEPAAESSAIRLVRHYRDLQTCTEPTSLALTGGAVDHYDVARMFEAVRRVAGRESQSCRGGEIGKLRGLKPLPHCRFESCPRHQSQKGRPLMSEVETFVPAPPHFVEFPKIARLNREVVVTEKIDGTNAQVYLKPKLEPGYAERVGLTGWVAENDAFWMFAGSRNRYITPEKDNFGFARWVKEHAVELFALGQGTHFGEWWGSGVQRGYGLVNGEKRFSLFNVGRWYDEHGTNAAYAHDEKCNPAPPCCYVVPILAVLPSFAAVNEVLFELGAKGSKAAPGFMKPEGIVAFHSASGALYKATCEKDEKPKGQAR